MTITSTTEIETDKSIDFDTLASDSMTRAIIPPFELTPPTRNSFCSGTDNESFELGDPTDAFLSSQPAWKKHVLPEPFENDDGKLVLGDGTGSNQEQALAMWGRDLKSKAQRLACCGRFGRRLTCIGVAQHSFFEPFNCGLRTCQRCAPLLARRLFERLASLERLTVKRAGWTIALLDFTLRNTGTLPDAELIRSTNLAVKRTMHRLLRRVEGWGYLWINELGFDNSNLHVHGIYYGPYLSVPNISAIWTEESGGSYRVWIQKAKKGFRPALWHHLKYVSKPPSNDPRRLAEVEVAFHRVRKVHTLGAFYAPDLEEVTEVDSGGAQKCPHCGEFIAIASGFCAVSSFEAEGLRNINAVRRAVFLKNLGTGPP